MLARAESWLARPRPERVTVVVSHGGFSRAFRCSYLGLGVERAQEIPTHAHGRLYELNGGLVNERVAVDELPPPEMLLG
jgi:broad specificity phosphatase PhoE